MPQQYLLVEHTAKDYKHISNIRSESWVSHLPRGVRLLDHLGPGEVDEEEHPRLGAAVVHVSLPATQNKATQRGAVYEVRHGKRMHHKRAARTIWYLHHTYTPSQQQSHEGPSSVEAGWVTAKRGQTQHANTNLVSNLRAESK